MKSRNRIVFMSAYLLLSAVLFVTTSRIRPERSVLLFLGAFSLAAAWGCIAAFSDAKMYEYVRRRWFACALVSIYASFASFGYRLFLAGERIEFSVKAGFYFAVGTLWFVPVVIFILYMLEKAGKMFAGLRQRARLSRRQTQLLCALISFLCLSVGLIAFYPGLYPIDVVNQFAQARGNFYLRDGHPVMHTMIIRILLGIYDSKVFVVLFQMACFAALVGYAAGIPYRCAVPQWLICAGTAIFSLLPNQIVIQICPMKDALFTSAMLWGTLLLLEFALDMDCIRRPGYWISLVISMLMTGTLRHNGVAPMALMMIFFIVITIRHYAKVRMYAAAAVGVCLALFGLYKGPVIQMLGALPNDATAYLTMFCAVGSVINKGETLSEESIEKIKTVMPLEDWAAYYSRFSGHDGYMFFREGGMDLTGFSMAEASKIYLDALVRHPDIVIKDRLDGSNLLWDVTQPKDSFNSRWHDYVLIDHNAGIEMPGYVQGEYYVNQSRLAYLYRRAIDFKIPGEEETGQLTNMLLWRSGAYQIFLLILALFWHKHRLHKIKWAALPLLGNNLIWAFGLYYQAFRYVYYVQVLTIVLTLATFLLLREREAGKG